jgi:hypothetical protein
MPTTTTATTITITVGSPDWIQKASKAIDQKNRVTLVIKGPEALTTAEAIRRTDAGASKIGGEEVAIAIAIVIGVIAVVGLGVVAAVCLYGMNKAYKVWARHRVNGPSPFDDELLIILTPPA